jgi:hypothetical protein
VWLSRVARTSLAQLCQYPNSHGGFYELLGNPLQISEWIKVISVPEAPLNHLLEPLNLFRSILFRHNRKIIA